MIARYEIRISESAFQKQVIGLAEALGWRVIHHRAARTSDGGWVTPIQGTYAKGFPDLLMVRDRIILVELKSEAGEMSREQKDWRRALMTAGVETHVWKPSDTEEIERVLKHRCTPA